MKEIDLAETSTIMYFDMPAWGLLMSECLATAHGRKVEYPISGDALARIQAPANPPMTAREAADKLGVTVQRVHQLRTDGKLTVAMKAPGLRGASFFTAKSVEQLKEDRDK